MQVSVIIVTYNTCRMTQECIDSIRRHTADVEYEIIVVDNASQDDSRDHFTADTSITYIYNERNVGFGSANNIGMARATGKYLLLLNSDTLLKNNALKIFCDAAEQYGERLGVMGTVLLSPQLTPTHSYGTFITIRNTLMEPINRFVLRLMGKTTRYARPTAPTEPMQVEYVTGADMLVPRKVYELTGGFDEEFFMYAEEVDWQLRISRAGFDRVIIGGAEIVHLEGASDASAGRTWSYSRFYNATRSRLLYIRKHYPPLAYAFFRVAYCILRTSTVIGLPYTAAQKRQLLTLLISRLK